MSDLISRSALKAYLEEIRQDYLEENTMSSNFAAEVIETVQDAYLADAPTVDAVEVVHGRWKYYHKKNIAVCTNCSFERDLDANFGKAVSCPNCGARMDGE